MVLHAYILIKYTLSFKTDLDIFSDACKCVEILVVLPKFISVRIINKQRLSCFEQTHKLTQKFYFYLLRRVVCGVACVYLSTSLHCIYAMKETT